MYRRRTKSRFDNRVFVNNTGHDGSRLSFLTKALALTDPLLQTPAKYLRTQPTALPKPSRIPDFLNCRPIRISFRLPKSYGPCLSADEYLIQDLADTPSKSTRRQHARSREQDQMQVHHTEITLLVGITTQGRNDSALPTIDCYPFYGAVYST